MIKYMWWDMVHPLIFMFRNLMMLRKAHNRSVSEKSSLCKQYDLNYPNYYRPNYKSWKGRKLAASCAQWAEVTSRGPLRGLWQPPPQGTSSQHIRGPVNFPVGAGVVISQFPNLELEMKTPPMNSPFWIFQLVTAPLLIEFRAESPHIKQATQKEAPG